MGGLSRRGRRCAVYWLIDARERLSQAIDDHEPRSVLFAVGRSMLAAAQLSVLIFNSDSTLFAAESGLHSGARCGGVRGFSLFCLTSGTAGGVALARTLAVVTFLAVLSGFCPRWTCLPHWYISFSLAAGMSLANGGDRASAVVTLLLVPLCLGDGRTWQWTRPESRLPGWWRGSSYAAHWVLRGQVVMIYATAATAKLTDPVWVQGRALRFVAFDALFGFPVTVRDFLEPVLASDFLVAAGTWGVIVVQYVIAGTIMSSRKWRTLATTLGCLLHLAIGVLLGLPSFGLVMIALLLCAQSSAQPAGVATESIWMGKRKFRKRGRIGDS